MCAPGWGPFLFACGCSELSACPSSIRGPLAQRGDALTCVCGSSSAPAVPSSHSPLDEEGGTRSSCLAAPHYCNVTSPAHPGAPCVPRPAVSVGSSRVSLALGASTDSAAILQRSASRRPGSLSSGLCYARALPAATAALRNKVCSEIILCEAAPPSGLWGTRLQNELFQFILQIIKQIVSCLIHRALEGILFSEKAATLSYSSRSLPA